MHPGQSEDLTRINDNRKTAIINIELRGRNVDIAALQETCLAESGSLKEKDDTFFWHGKQPEEPHQHGAVWRCRLRCLSHLQRRETGLCTCTHIIWDIFLPVLSCFWVLRRERLPSHKVGRQAVQPGSTESKEEGS